jgi:hypothetical protein
MSLEHPSWCSRTECLHTATATPIHLSRPTRVRSGCGDLTISVQLAQLGDDEPVVAMIAAFAAFGPDPAEEYPIRLDAGLAREVGWLLLTTGRRAAHGQNPRP